jgi:hypothetical protein
MNNLITLIIHLPPGVLIVFVRERPLIIVSCLENEFNFNIYCRSEQNIDYWFAHWDTQYWTVNCGEWLWTACWVLLWMILNLLLWWVTLNCPQCGSEKNVPADSTNNLLNVLGSNLCNWLLQTRTTRALSLMRKLIPSRYIIRPW